MTQNNKGASNST